MAQRPHGRGIPKETRSHRSQSRQAQPQRQGQRRQEPRAQPSNNQIEFRDEIKHSGDEIESGTASERKQHKKQDSNGEILVHLRNEFTQLNNTMTGILLGIGNLNGRVGALENGMDSLVRNSRKIKRGLDTLDDNVVSINGNISRIHDDMDDFEDDIDDLKDDMTELKEDMTGVKQSIRNIRGTVNQTHAHVKDFVSCECNPDKKKEEKSQEFQVQQQWPETSQGKFDPRNSNSKPDDRSQGSRERRDGTGRKKRSKNSKKRREFPGNINRSDLNNIELIFITGNVLLSREQIHEIMYEYGIGIFDLLTFLHYPRMTSEEAVAVIAYKLQKEAKWQPNDGKVVIHGFPRESREDMNAFCKAFPNVSFSAYSTDVCADDNGLDVLGNAILSKFHMEKTSMFMEEIPLINDSLSESQSSGGENYRQTSLDTIP